MIHEFPPPSQLLARISREGPRPKRALGQRYLIDEPTLRRIADLARVDSETLVIEIGPGPATLTTLLRPRAGGLLAVERDRGLRDFQEPLFEGDDCVQFHYADALRVDLQALAREHMTKWKLSRAVLTGNLPFQITSPLLFGQCAPGHPWASMTFMVQREVADRIAASHGSRDYGILTVKLAFAWKVVERFEVSATMFRPCPKVDAAVLRFDPAEGRAGWAHTEWPVFSRFIDRCFNQRRKKLYNSPAAGALGVEGRAAFRAAIESLGLNPDCRPEELSPGQFHELFRALFSSPSVGTPEKG